MVNIESCQAHGLTEPFHESDIPELLMQDIVIDCFLGYEEKWADKANVNVTSLRHWLGVIDFWFEKYGPYATAVKSQAAYRRDINFKKRKLSTAGPLFEKQLAGRRLSQSEKTILEDLLFGYCVQKAVQYALPVKLHTGYHVGCNTMPLSMVQKTLRPSPSFVKITLMRNSSFYTSAIPVTRILLHWPNILPTHTSI